MNKVSTFFTALFCVIALMGHSKVYYVAPAGSDTQAGTIAEPFLTIQRAQTAVAAGDTVYVRGGVYMMSNTNISGHSTASAGSYAYITYLTKSGTATARINYWAYPGERPVFNYVNVDPSVTNTNTSTNPNAVPAPYRISAFEVTGSYIHLRGLEVVGVPVAHVSTSTNTLSICFSQSGAGGNNIYERLSMHDGKAIGFYLTRGPNNLILNCDAYRNNDDVNVGNKTGTANGGNVDGFGCHPNNANYTGNVFRGCRAWQNSDDGYDCISASAATTFENCWAFSNGYDKNFVSRGDGNGFKAGGYGTATSFPTIIPNNTVQFCLSVGNKANGFYSNHHQAGSYWYNNTAYQNATNYNMVNRKDRTTSGYLTDVPGYGHVLRNNISLKGRSTVSPDTSNISSSASTFDHNTFGKGVIAVSTSDFVSLDTTGIRASRQADGSLPKTNLLLLVPGSHLIDAGIDVGFPYSGSAPDLGYRETQAITFAPLADKAVGDADFAPGATASSGLPVSYSSSDPAVATITADGKIHIVGSGSVLITASQGGNGVYGPAQLVSQQLNVFLPPLIKTKNIEVAVDGSGHAVITPSMVDDGSVSYNGTLTLGLDQTSFDCATIGTPVTVTLTGTDEKGYSRSATAEVTIVDQTAPLLTAPASQLLCYAGSTYTIPTLAAADNCGVATVTYSVAGATVRSGAGTDATGSFNVGVSTITWTVTDVHGNQATGATTVTVNAPITVSIPDVYAVSQTTDAKNTLYIGYGPASLALNATVAGGTAPYTYEWNSGQTTQSIQVSTAGTYTVTITDAKGCTQFATIAISVVDVSCGNNNDKVMVCHNGVSICVASVAVQAHLNHGDRLGTCSATAKTAGVASTSQVRAAVAQEESKVVLYPNPVTNNLTISLPLSDKGATLKLYSTTGAMVVSKNLTSSTNTISLEDLPTGVYYVQILNGQQITTDKLVKQ